MPSGVEHRRILLAGDLAAILIAASMPSGVEHSKPVLSPNARTTDRRLDAFGR